MKGLNQTYSKNSQKGQQDIIHIQSSAFERLLDAVMDRVIDYIKENYPIHEETWISEEEVFRLTGITSKTTLLRLRQTGKVKYTQPFRGKIKYDRQSVCDFLNQHIKNTF